MTPTYDAKGNLTSAGSTTYTYSSENLLTRAYLVNGLNQYTQVGPAGAPQAFGYDANGNLTADGTNAYVYDAENRLVSATRMVNGVATTIATLSYDPAGRLWQVASPSGTTRFLYDGDRLVFEFDGAGNPLRAYVHGAGPDEPLLWYEAAAGWQRRYLHADHQGSIVAIADESGNKLAINGYDEWGIPNAGNVGRFGYTGQAWIPELGMWYYKARMYSPTLGRFLQSDPVGYKDQVNLYAYVGNDPVDGRDPLGMYECTASNSDCAEIRKYRGELARAARDAQPPIGSRLLSLAAQSLKNADAYLGREGDGNGVKVDSQSLAPGNAGSTADATTIHLDLAQARSAIAKHETTGGGIMGHEASHALTFARKGGIQSLSDAMQRERLAYSVQSMVDETLGAGSLYYQPYMSDAARAARIQWWAHRSCAAYANEVQPRQFDGESCLR